MVAEYLRAHQNFGMHIEISYEEVLLDTGGGLKQAAPFFLDSDEPFLVHNVDVLSTIDFRPDAASFTGSTKALQPSLFKIAPRRAICSSIENGHLCGRRTGLTGESELVRPIAEPRAMAFSGIHILSPRVFSPHE